jgi:hypothetical protein
MNTASIAFDALRPGLELGPLRLAVSAAANERYWRAAGVDHPALQAGSLYPPIAANLTVLVFGAHCAESVIQTRQVLRCHRAAQADCELLTTATVDDVYDKRGRRYVDLTAHITTTDAPELPLWTSAVSFTPASTLERGA